MTTGNIFFLTADALAFPANPSPIIGGSLDSQVYNFSGEELLKERKKHGDLNYGEALITSSFNLERYNWLIHIATPVYSDENKTESIEKLKECYFSALNCADKENLKTIVFAVLGAGANKFPYDVAINTAESSINEYFAEHPDSGIEKVTVVKYKKEAQYQLLIKINNKIKELNELLSQLSSSKDEEDIMDAMDNSYIGSIRETVAKYMENYTDLEMKPIRKSYEEELDKYYGDEEPEEYVYQSLIDENSIKKNWGSKTNFGEAIYTKNISHILSSRNHHNKITFLNKERNVFKLGLGLKLPYDKMYWLMWCRGFDNFPSEEFEREILEYYVRKEKHFDALIDYEDIFNKKYEEDKDRTN